MAEDRSEDKENVNERDKPSDGEPESAEVEGSREVGKVTSLPPPAWEERPLVAESPIKIIDESPSEIEGGVFTVHDSVKAQESSDETEAVQESSDEAVAAPRRGFDVIFTGGILKNHDIENVKQNLVASFGIERSRVDKLFTGREVVVKTNADRRTASEYMRACEHAGAFCRMEPHPARLYSPPPQRQEPARNPSQAPTAVPRFQPQLVTPQLGPSKAMFTPIKCLRLTRPERGLEFLGPLGREERPVEDVLLVSVFESTVEAQKELQMLCFVKGIRRPYLINAGAIIFKDFPGVLGQGSVASLRNLMRLLFAINPRIILDQGTYDFMQGKPPVDFEKDLVVLATAFGTHLEEAAQTSERDSVILSVKR